MQTVRGRPIAGGIFFRLVIHFHFSQRQVIHFAPLCSANFFSLRSRFTKGRYWPLKVHLFTLLISQHQLHIYLFLTKHSRKIQQFWIKYALYNVIMTLKVYQFIGNLAFYRFWPIFRQFLAKITLATFFEKIDILLGDEAYINIYFYY